MIAAEPVPTLSLRGPDTILRRHVAVQLRILGYCPDQAAMPTSTHSDDSDATIEVVCPDATDCEGLDALHAVLEHGTGTLPESTAYVFVVPGSLERLRSALEAVRGRRYFALLDSSVHTEVLERQLGLAARWLYTTAGYPTTVAPPDTRPELSPVGP